MQSTWDTFRFYEKSYVRKFSSKIMADEETNFDPSLKKKKKKKKTPFDLDGALNEGGAEENAEVGASGATPEPVADDDIDLENFGKKKKKKKKVLDEDEEKVDEEKETTKDEDADLDLESFGKKKKKKKPINMKELEEALPDDKADDNADVDLENFGKKKRPKKKKNPVDEAAAEDNKENADEGSERVEQTSEVEQTSQILKSGAGEAD